MLHRLLILNSKLSSRLRDVFVWGRSSVVFKVTDTCRACHEFEPSTAEHPPCRGGDARLICRGSNVLAWGGVEEGYARSGVVRIT
ncbi:hypothetical protein TNCV_1544201 [Trichonephila clavipes]|nr:hypothetical protein TNCV_1544201 [Trichonephila clavipes]